MMRLRGKGYYKHVLEAGRRKVTPFVGKRHRDASGSLSEGVFKGFRGVIDASNVPALAAVLKNGGIFRYLYEGQDFWVVEYPSAPKFKRLPSDKENGLKVIAGKIVLDSLDSFRGIKAEKNEIPSTQEARGAVKKYKPFSNVKVLDEEDKIL